MKFHLAKRSLLSNISTESSLCVLLRNQKSKYRLQNDTLYESEIVYYCKPFLYISISHWAVWCILGVLRNRFSKVDSWQNEMF